MTPILDVAWWEGQQLSHPPLPRSGQCGCGGLLVEREDPAPGIRFATLCNTCGKWLRWEVAKTDPEDDERETSGPGWPDARPAP